MTRNPLKAGMKIDSNKVKTGLKAKIAEFFTVKMGFKPGSFKNLPAAHTYPSADLLPPGHIIESFRED